MTERKRHVDVTKMSQEELDELSAKLGQSVGQQFKEMSDKVRKLLNIYGLDIKVGYSIFPKGSKSEFEE